MYAVLLGKYIAKAAAAFLEQLKCIDDFSSLPPKSAFQLCMDCRYVKMRPELWEMFKAYTVLEGRDFLEACQGPMHSNVRFMSARAKL